jgi:hypothetical protein
LLDNKDAPATAIVPCFKKFLLDEVIAMLL